MQNGDEALSTIILAGQTDYYISTTGCAYHCQLKCILSHRNIQVPIGLVVEVILTRHLILKQIHCVGDRTLKSLS